MIIENVERSKNDCNVYDVTLRPMWIEWLIGKRRVTKQYKETDRYYTNFNFPVYIRKNGSKLGPHHRVAEAIENFKRAF